MSVPQGAQWTSVMQDMTINGSSVWNTTIHSDSTINFVTGYEYIGMPAEAFYGICNLLKGYIATTNYTNTTVSCASNSTKISANSSCDYFEDAGNFTMQFSTSATFVMKLETLMHDKDDDYGNETCYWNFRKTASNTTIYIGE